MVQGESKAACRGLAGSGAAQDKVLPALAVTSTTPVPLLPGDFGARLP